MKVLLDTNIIIHRENKRVTNYSIGHLFRWLDKLRFEKIIHPYSISEIKKYKDPETQESISVKLESYDVIKVVIEPDEDFLSKINRYDKSENDIIDNYLLYEVYSGRVDFFITEDRRLRNKAVLLGITDRVFSINGFIDKVTSENPELIEYKALSVEKVYFGNVNVNDSFFDSFRKSYDNFDQWFNRKFNEEAYICRSDAEKILGFLYLKTEDESENYSDIEPIFSPKRRLKVGTFKVESTGFRLGERFIKIIFDNALKRKIDEIYVTLFDDREELVALEDLFYRWGFVFHGYKNNGEKREKVLKKFLHTIDYSLSPMQNFPNISYSCNKFIVPILPQYHTTLLPDSQLKNENRIDFLGKEAHRYALQKVYISWAPTNGAKPGDIIIFYRMGWPGENKKYTSVVSSVAIVDEIIENVKSENDLFNMCKNRSVFSTAELKAFWAKKHNNLKILKFIFVKSLSKRLILGYLWDNNIIPAPNGPRSFTRISDTQFDMIMRDSETEIEYVE